MKKVNMGKERIGTKFKTKEGYEVIVIDYVNSKKVQVMFLDDYQYKTWTNWNNLERGKIKNPFHKSVHGVGYLGTLENGEVPKCHNSREYKIWWDMLERCYNNDKYPTYKNCIVAEEWHSFSKFVEDLPKIKGYDYWKDNPQQKISLNKDIYYKEIGIITDYKTYSLLTTRFISNSENSKEQYERHGNPQKLKKKVRCIETNIIYESTRQAERETGINQSSIIKTCKGKQATSGGYHGEYID